MEADGEQSNAKYLWKRIKALGRDEITQRDLFEKCKGKLQKMEAMEKVLNTLEGMGYVRVITEATGGRPSKKILINPLAQNSQ